LALRQIESFCDRMIDLGRLMLPDILPEA
jgi:hypothetical protein